MSYDLRTGLLIIKTYLHMKSHSYMFKGFRVYRKGNNSKKEQRSGNYTINLSTTPDLGYHMGK